MTYVMSDIHGHRRRFENVMEQICLQPEDTLYILGDIIDRNPDGIRILRQVMAMPNVKMLLGNHELMMLEALYEPFLFAHDTNEFLLEQKLRLWSGTGTAERLPTIS